MAPMIRSPSNAGLVMMRVRISWMRSNISCSFEYASSPTPYNFSAFGVLPPLWSRAAMKPSPERIFSNCSWFWPPCWSVALRPGRARIAAAAVCAPHGSRLPVRARQSKGIGRVRTDPPPWDPGVDLLPARTRGNGGPRRDHERRQGPAGRRRGPGPWSVNPGRSGGRRTSLRRFLYPVPSSERRRELPNRIPGPTMSGHTEIPAPAPAIAGREAVTVPGDTAGEGGQSMRHGVRQALALIAVLAAAAVPPAARAQEQPDPATLLPQPILDRIADEVSGAVAMRHVYELGAYEGKRYESEYRDTYFETEYVARMAREYGLSDVHVVRFEASPQWHARRGELWLETPVRRLLISHRDVPAALVPGSASADVTTELVYIGRGTRPSDYEGKDVRGKIVLTTGPIAAVVQPAVVERGAIGIVSTHNALGKSIDRPDLISWTRVPQPAEGPRIFAFALSHRLGQEVIDLVERGPVRVRAVVETEVFPDVTHQVTVASIPGDGSTDEEVAFIAHLFEGVTKQGAGDNISGSATILEVARAYKRLIDEGVLPRPRRTIRFLWVPEFVGSIPYFEANGDWVARLLAGINMDMVGASLVENRGNLKLYRTPASLPTFVSDVAQQFMEYVGETNREKVHNRRIAYAFSRPMIDPTGTQDPFYYHIEKFYGSSDHLVFGQAGVPFIFFNHWPDAVYHSSEDRPRSLDPTQLKRTAFIGVATAAILAGAGAEDVAKLAALTAGYAGERVGGEVRTGIQQMAAAEPSELATAYFE